MRVHFYVYYRSETGGGRYRTNLSYLEVLKLECQLAGESRITHWTGICKFQIRTQLDHILYCAVND